MTDEQIVNITNLGGLPLAQIASLLASQLRHISVYTDPNNTLFSITPDELHTIVLEQVQRAQSLDARLQTAARRWERIAQQEAIGGLCWNAIKAIMIERGYTHKLNFDGTRSVLATWEGPYGNGIPDYWRGLLRPDRGPGFFSDCMLDHDTPAFIGGMFECVQEEPTAP
jgi:hypothetical protein